MKYLCLIYDEEKQFDAMAKSDVDTMMGEYRAFTDDIKKKGHRVASTRPRRPTSRR